MKKLYLACLLWCGLPLSAQIATINWTNVHQVIDGFGAADAQQNGIAMATATANEMFGTGTGQIGLSLLRVGVTDGAADPGNCATVGTSCLGGYLTDMQTCLANGCRIYGTPWSPAAIFKTNSNTECELGSGSGGPIQALLLNSSVAPVNVSGNSWTYTFLNTQTGAGSNAWAGYPFTLSGFIGSATGNNGTFTATASTTTTVTLTNATGTTNHGGSSVLSAFPAMAQWDTNFALSLAANGVPLYALSLQNEPEGCHYSDSSYFTGSQMDSFIVSALHPAFVANSVSTLIFLPEPGGYNLLTTYGSACASDPACYSVIGGWNYHDYQSVYLNNYQVAPTPLPTSWSTTVKYWETETCCLPTGPIFCIGQTGSFQNTIYDAIKWAGVIDQRIAGDNENAWFWWWINANSPEGLVNVSIPSSAYTQVAKRAYALGQYARFVRPGYYRIDATHFPQPGISVSAYQDLPSSTLVVIATNQTTAPVTQTFQFVNTPTVGTLTPTQTSATNSLTPLATVTPSGQSFTYTLPAQSVTTFTGTVSGSIPAPPPSGTSTLVGATISGGSKQ